MDRQVLSGEVHLSLLRGDPTIEEYHMILDGVFLRGRFIDRIVVPNLVTNHGLTQMLDRCVNGNATNPPSHIGASSAITVPVATSVALPSVPEIMRKALSTTAVYNIYYQRYALTFLTTDFNNTVMGLGLFDGALGGLTDDNLWAMVGTNITKDATQSLVVDWRIQVLTA